MVVTTEEAQRVIEEEAKTEGEGEGKVGRGVRPLEPWEIYLLTNTQ